MRREAVMAFGGFDDRLRAGEDTDLYVRLGTVGQIATVRRRTVMRAATSGSLKERARRSGDYLAGGELSAANLVAAVERLPEPERTPLLDHAWGTVHLARAMSALDRGDRDVLSAELERADRLLPRLSKSPWSFADRLRLHLTRVHEPGIRLRALTMTAELWPDPRADTARFMRVLAIATALGVGRLGEAARLTAAWPRGRTPSFLWHRVPQFYRLTRLWIEYGRQGRQSEAWAGPAALER